MTAKVTVRLELFRKIFADARHYSVEFEHPMRDPLKPVLLCGNCDRQCPLSYIGIPDETVVLCITCYNTLKDIDKPIDHSKKRKAIEEPIPVSEPRNVREVVPDKPISPPNNPGRPAFSFGFTRVPLTLTPPTVTFNPLNLPPQATMKAF